MARSVTNCRVASWPWPRSVQAFSGIGGEPDRGAVQPDARARASGWTAPRSGSPPMPEKACTDRGHGQLATRQFVTERAMQRRSDRHWRAPFAVDVSGVLSVHRRGFGDPAFARDADGAVWRGCRTPDGPGTIRIASRTEASDDPIRSARVTVVRAQAWGPGAGWLLDAMPGLLGADDRPEEFVPAHPALREAA